MSNISRRTFLKSAGAAALAVAAAGVLAGCSEENIPGTDVPETPVTSEDVTVYFVDNALNDGQGGGVGDTYTMSILKGSKKLDPTLIPADKLPEGYELADKALVDVLNNGNQTFALVPVTKKAAQPATKKRVRVTLKFTTPGDADRYLTVDINDANATQVKFEDIKDALNKTYDDVQVWDETWYSDLQVASGYWDATRPLVVARK